MSAADSVTIEEKKSLQQGSPKRYYRKQVDFFRLIKKTDIRLVNSAPEALWMASRAWKAYTINRSKELQCTSCGNKQKMRCEQCGQFITGRQRFMADFLIGGHALFHAGTLLTRDRGYYQQYFPELAVIS